MSTLTILDNIRVASPCPVAWDSMAGDDRVRFCSGCSKSVYNIVAMTAEEATALIFEGQGEVCGRIFRRADGKVLTSDCPMGEGPTRSRRSRRILAMALLIPALMVSGATALGRVHRPAGPYPGFRKSSWDVRVEWVLVTLGLKQPEQIMFSGSIHVE